MQLIDKHEEQWQPGNASNVKSVNNIGQADPIDANALLNKLPEKVVGKNGNVIDVRNGIGDLLKV